MLFCSGEQMKPYLFLLPLAAMFSWTAPAQTIPIPASGLCNTGLTPASPLPAGCATSTLVTPVNPESGGTSVDGNWQLATPYPSAAAGLQSPDPCLLGTFGPAWIDVPFSNWLTPDTGLAQWITPQVITPGNTSGWYIYRTPVSVPAATPGYAGYILSVTGKVATDNDTRGIALGYGRKCTVLSIPALRGQYGWSEFSFEVLVSPATQPYLYFLTYNLPNNSGSAAGSPAGVVVEFTSAFFTPI
jgi:hypothetical protein